MRVAFVIVSATIFALVVAITASNWYEYRLQPDLVCRETASGMVNNNGWEITPGQTNPCYYRRPRLHI